MSIIYRKATVDDQKILWDFYELAYEDKAAFLKDPYWSWLNISNPLQENITETNTYIAVDEITDQIAGHYTVILQNFKVNGRQVQFSWGINLFVGMAFRGQGIAKRLQTLLIEEHPIYTAISIAASTRKMIMNMAGAVELPDTYTMSLPIHANKDQLFDLRMKYFKSNLSLKLLAFLLKRSAGLTGIAKDLFYKWYIQKSEKVKDDQVNTDFITTVESHFSDAAFLKLRSDLFTQFEAYPNDSPEYLNWKFESHPAKKYKLFIQYEKNHPTGYVILRTGMAPEKNMGIISEIFANNDISLLRLIEFTKACFKKNKCIGAHVVVQHPLYVKAFQKEGFFITNKRKPVALAKDRANIAFLENIKTWYFTFESQDLDFYPNMRI